MEVTVGKILKKGDDYIDIIGGKKGKGKEWRINTKSPDKIQIGDVIEIIRLQ